MRAPNDAVGSYLSRGDISESDTILGGEALSAFEDVVAAESGEPLGKNAAVVKFDCRNRVVVVLILAFAVFCGGMVCRELLYNDAYAGNRQALAWPAVLLVFIAGFAVYSILHAGFSDRWLILEEDRVRFRVRRFIRYRIESFPFASIKEIANETYPTRRGELARLVIALPARRAELFQGHVEAAENGHIAWTAGLLSAATGVPVTVRVTRNVHRTKRRR